MSWHRDQVRKPGVTTQVLLADALRERDEARAMVARLTDERDSARSGRSTFRGERDEARAMVARLRAELSFDHGPDDYGIILHQHCRACLIVAQFQALPWAKDADA